MVTEQEKRFVAYWREHRAREKKVLRQWYIGLPAGLLFGIPILINFASGWYKKADMWERGHADEHTPVVLAIAVLLIATFIAIFYKRHKWDMYEQQYHEILGRMEDEKHSQPGTDNIKNI